MPPRGEDLLSLSPAVSSLLRISTKKKSFTAVKVKILVEIEIAIALIAVLGRSTFLQVLNAMQKTSSKSSEFSRCVAKKMLKRRGLPSFSFLPNLTNIELVFLRREAPSLCTRFANNLLFRSLTPFFGWDLSDSRENNRPLAVCRHF